MSKVGKGIPFPFFRRILCGSYDKGRWTAWV
nr:MAG TPA: hypothetical protein [Bacteriophage sp.]